MELLWISLPMYYPTYKKKLPINLSGSLNSYASDKTSMKPKWDRNRNFQWIGDA
jgi:hypothetical protein